MYFFVPCLLRDSENEEFRSHGKTDLDSRPLADAMVQSTRSQEQKLPIEDCVYFIKTGTY